MKVQTQINNSAIRNPNSALPRSWRWVRLGEVCEVKGGKRLPSGYEFSKERTPYPYIRVVDMRGVSIKMQGLKYLTPEVKGIILKYTISADNVYISIAGTIGIVGTIPIELDGANLTENAAKLVIKDKTILHRDYLWLFLSSENGQRAIKKRINLVGQPKLALFRIKTIPMLLPPLPEQKRIAAKIQELMQDVERARTACEKQLEAAKVLPAAYLRQVFESEEAKKWERKRLGEVCEIISKGTTPTTYGHSFVPSGIPFLRAEDISGGPVDFSSVAFHITNETHDFLKRSKLYPGDLLITIAGTLGRVGYILEDAPEGNCNQAVAFARVVPIKSDVKFLCYILQILEVLSPFVELKAGGTIQNLNLEQVRSIEIPIPPLTVQHHIASELKEKMAEVEKLRTGIEKELEAITTLPQVILRKAFRGEL